MDIQVITPVLNEEKSILPYLKIIKQIKTNLKKRGVNLKLAFINNCSNDNTLEVIKKESKRLNFKIEYISFTRNFGYQASIFCGLEKLKADAYFINDVDLEDPPEMINEFLKLYKRKYKIIYGIRSVRKGNILMNYFRNLYYRILKRVADNDFTPYMAEFSLIDKEVRNELIRNKSNFPFLRSEFSYLSYKKIGVNYIRNTRQTGKTNYSFWGILKFAVTGFLSTSTFLLRLNTYLSFLIIFLNVIFLFLYLYYNFNFIYLLFINISFIILMLSSISLYIARIYKDNLNRPLFVIDNDNSKFET